MEIEFKIQRLKFNILAIGKYILDCTSAFNIYLFIYSLLSFAYVMWG